MNHTNGILWVEGYKLFRRPKRISRGMKLAYYVKKWINCKDLSIKGNQTGWVLVGKRNWASNGGWGLHLVVVIHYRLWSKGACWQSLPVSATRSIVFTGSDSDEGFQPPTMSAGKASLQSLASLNLYPTIPSKGQIWDYLERVNMYKFMGLDNMHPSILNEMAYVVIKPLSIIFGKVLAVRWGPYP